MIRVIFCQWIESENPVFWVLGTGIGMFLVVDGSVRGAASSGEPWFAEAAY